MSEPFVSIVMPVFNASANLRRAIFSVFNQTFYDFELILVDDHSTDQSLKICRELEKKDPRVKVIALEKNSGASAARNAALDVIGGRYVTFVDADDWLEDNVLARAARAIKSEPSIDVLKYGCSEDYVDRDGRVRYRKICRAEDRAFRDRASMARAAAELETIPLFGYIWNGFYRAALVKKYSLRFDERCRVNEDFFFNAEILRRAKVLRTIDCSGYHYEKRGSGSLSSTAANYSYAINRRKIAELIGLFDGAVPSDVEEKIFWMYARFCYAALVDGEKLSVIRADPLFDRFRRIKFDGVGSKKKILIGLLRKNFLAPILFCAVKVIGGIKRLAPTLFARLKR